MIEYLREPGGFAASWWCGSAECEARVKEDSSATIRCLPLADDDPRSGACIRCGRPGADAAVWAQAY
jgi:prolyl-tRNA synthetase